MGAVPKRRISKARAGRRQSHLALRATKVVNCPQCGAPVRPHHVCLSCGTYRGVQVIQIEEE